MKYEIIKGSEKDFDGYNDDIITIYRVNGIGHFHYSVQPASKLSGCSLGHLVDIIAERRPITEPVWDGEGLPPVGVEVDIVDINECLRYGQNESGEVIAHVENTAVVRMSYGLGCFEAEFLRLARSPEDVARDEAINDMLIIEGEMHDYYQPHELISNIYEEIAAGKIRGITKTPTVSELMRVTEKATREDCEAIVKMMERSND